MNDANDAVTSLAITAGTAARTANTVPGDRGSPPSDESRVEDATATPPVADIGPVTLGVPGPSEAGLPVVSAAGTAGRFIWPVDSRRISTLFGPSHQAIDIDEWPAGGTPVRAIANGIVTFAGGQACCSYGLYVIVQHAGGYSSLYAHFSSLSVSLGQAVAQGQQLGLSGCTGYCTGAHLHFAIYLHWAPLDPLLALPPGARIE